MKSERTLSIIKPDAVESKLSGDIISFIEKKGLKILLQKSEAFYKWRNF